MRELLFIICMVLALCSFIRANVFEKRTDYQRAVYYMATAVYWLVVGMCLK